MMTYEQKLEEVAQRNDALVVMTAENRAAIRNLPRTIGNRFVDVGICEQTMVGAAAGLALRGRVPVVHALATFLTLRAFEFVRTDVGIGNLPVKLVGGVPGFLSDANGPTHQAIEDVSLMRGIPPMHVFCPADEVELVAGMEAVIASNAPTYIRFNAAAPSVTHTSQFEIGKAEVLSDGTDVALLVYGFLLREAVKARTILESKGRSVRLINVRMPKPIDEHVVINAARETRLVVTLEDHFLTGGLFSIVSEILVKNRLSVPVLPIALENKWFKPALLEDVLRYEGFTGEQIAGKILKMWN
jgi:transketolase